MKRLLVIAILALGSVVSAQPAAVLGEPLPAADLDVGTISVRVVAGRVTAPVANLTVTLVVSGKLQTAVTDAAGRAHFVGIAAGANVFARITASDGLAHTSRTFTVPSAGGMRLMLSTEDWHSELPSARELSGMPRADAKVPAGSLVVRVSYDDLQDPKPPANVAVALVGYAADDTVKVITQRTDQLGEAHFSGLDQSGATAYFAMTQLPRKSIDDRLIGTPAVLDATSGMRLVLAGERRTSTAAAVDELARLVEQDATVRAGKVAVRLEGALPEGEHAVSLIDATSGKVVASGKTKDPSLELALPFHAGQVVYAETTSRGRRLRSAPFQPVAARGTTTRIYDLPRILPSFKAHAQLADHDTLDVVAALDVQNNAWAPTEPAGLELALPAGFAKAELHDDDRALATLTKTGVRLNHALQPGSTRVRVAFTLPVVGGKVAWSLELPYGTYKSAIRIDKQKGTSVDAPASATITDAGENLDVDNISIAPKQAMVMTIHPGELPKLGPVDAACKPLQPERKPALGGKPLVDFTLPQLDGKPLHLASLRGKVLLVNFTASFASFAKPEPASLAKLQQAVRDVVVVVVASDRDRHNVEELLGTSPPYKVVLDAPADEHDLGEVTGRWGVVAIPESFLVDRSGTVRFYFQNLRDWSSPDALACVRALAK